MDNPSVLAGRGADRCMHAALHLVGKHWTDKDFSYEDPAVRMSQDPAITVLRTNYAFLCDWLKFFYVCKRVERSQNDE